MAAVDLLHDQDSTTLQDHREQRGRVARKGTASPGGAADARGAQRPSRAAWKRWADSHYMLLNDITAR